MAGPREEEESSMAHLGNFFFLRGNEDKEMGGQGPFREPLLLSPSKPM